MTLFQGKYRRTSLRLSGWDYTQDGFYFVTVCTRKQGCFLGEIKDGLMRLSEIGNIIAEEWQKITEVRENVLLDQWVVMPNHVHGIIQINHSVGATRRVAPTPIGPVSGSIGAIIGQFKSITTKRIKKIDDTINSIWQRNYYEHVIRDDFDLNRIREYINNNPVQWLHDENNRERQ